MSFKRRAMRSGATAAGIALALALVTPAVAETNGGVRFDGGRASAAPVSPVGITATIINREPVPANGRVNCFNYWGTFKAGTYVIVVDWATSANHECFGIAPDRTIWHAWPGSGGWRVMPGNGRADFVDTVGEDSTTGRRQVSVWVVNSGYWCQDYWPTKWTASWYRCA
ncbi:hypothetical protein SAMN05216188_12760 [Lentzea xinjiangensis]|uniref:Peptidase inhibitor family I36 n=1 Tax=Lentzea xinjiangensis TaxID=402600 RepID=A0A1H9VPD1_9PSEU|nr:hypothetical protein [Lentzea xinjiangensis]SES23411.1 hypothetical protein SAMN05216188_12760 [Lentzea xinjiangensis]